MRKLAYAFGFTGTPVASTVLVGTTLFVGVGCGVVGFVILGYLATGVVALSVPATRSLIVPA